ncbi:MAG: ATP-binding protein, partial [Lacunisphaera sp.]
PVPAVLADRGKALQILVNLISNAKYAAEKGPQPEKIITLRIAAGNTGHIQLSVTDNGEGIPAENLRRIFNHGFTTKATGHGFGLHCSANAAREMKGSLTVHSDGPGTGATFVLDLPASMPV